MGCNSCKSKSHVDENGNWSVNPTAAITTNIIGKVLLWLVACILTPLIIPISWIMLFRQIVLSKGTNLIPAFTKIGKTLSKKDSDEEDNDEDYESIEDIDPEDYELDNVEVIR